MKRKKIIIIIVALLVVGGAIGGGVAYYMWNKPHRNIEAESPDFEMTAPEFTKAYLNEGGGNEKFLNNVVLVTGQVNEIGSEKSGRKSLIMKTENGDIMASLDQKYWKNDEYKARSAAISKGDEVSVKCYCSGVIRDTMMGLVVSNIALKNCFIEDK